MQSYQSVIRNHKEENSQLITTNKQLTNEVQSLKKQLQRLQHKIQSDPLFNIFQGIEGFSQINNMRPFSDYKQLQQRLNIYQDKLQRSDRRNNVMENRLSQCQSKLLRAFEENIHFENKNLQLQNQIKMIELENVRLTEVNYRIDQIIKATARQSDQTNEAFQNLRREMLQKDNDQTYQLIKYSDRLQNLSKAWLSASTTVIRQAHLNDPNFQPQYVSSQHLKQLGQRFKQQQQIMQQMGRQLDHRNEQIAKLLTMQGNSQRDPSHQYSSSTHTLKSMHFLMIEKQKKLKDLMENYKHILESFDHNDKEKQQLQKQYIELKHNVTQIKTVKEQNAQLKKQLQVYKKNFEAVKYQLESSDKMLKQILEENSAFHHMMHDRYGDQQYMARIQTARISYEKRWAERIGKQRWANYQELIQMNRKLREKLKDKK